MKKSEVGCHKLVVNFNSFLLTPTIIFLDLNKTVNLILWSCQSFLLIQLQQRANHIEPTWSWKDQKSWNGLEDATTAKEIDRRKIFLLKAEMVVGWIDWKQEGVKEEVKEEAEVVWRGVELRSWEGQVPSRSRKTAIQFRERFSGWNMAVGAKWKRKKTKRRGKWRRREEEEAY